MSRMLIDCAPQRQATVPAQVSIADTAATILVSNAKRKGFLIQNTGTTILKLVLGVTNPTQTVYHFALKGGTAADDGTGASYTDDSWVGPVQAISSAAGGTFVMVEFQSGGPDWNAAEDVY
jgi:hypothetical protein